VHGCFEIKGIINRKTTFNTSLNYSVLIVLITNSLPRMSIVTSLPLASRFAWWHAIFTQLAQECKLTLDPTLQPRSLHSELHPQELHSSQFILHAEYATHVTHKAITIICLRYLEVSNQHKILQDKNAIL